MFKRLFGGGDTKTVRYPSTLVDYYNWLMKLPQQETVGKANSDSDNSILTWFEFGHPDARYTRLQHGKITWLGAYSVSNSHETETWMGQVLTLANNRTGSITAAIALADCTQIMNEMNVAFEQSKQALVTQQEQRNDALLQAPPLPGKQGKNGQNLKLVCWYCHKNVPNNIPRSVMDYTEENTGTEQSSTASVRIITFTCPSCQMENQQQMDIHGQVSVRDTTPAQ